MQNIWARALKLCVGTIASFVGVKLPLRSDWCWGEWWAETWGSPTCLSWYWITCSGARGRAIRASIPSMGGEAGEGSPYILFGITWGLASGTWSRMSSAEALLLAGGKSSGWDLRGAGVLCFHCISLERSWTGSRVEEGSSFGSSTTDSSLSYQIFIGFLHNLFSGCLLVGPVPKAFNDCFLLPFLVL